jgi:hypothetical protein
VITNPRIRIISVYPPEGIEEVNPEARHDMSLDGLKKVLDQASVGGAAPIKLPFDQIEATCGLNLDSDDNKIAVGQWAEQNGYTMTADVVNREVVFAPKD